MGILRYLILVTVLAGCGLLGERELPLKTVRLGLSSSECQMPGKEELRAVSEATVRQLADCIDKQIGSAFSQVRGEKAGELSPLELKALQQAGILDVPLKSDADWETVGALLSFFHPDGKRAIHREALSSLISWLREHAGLIAETFHDVDDDEEKNIDRLAAEWGKATLALSHHISDSGAFHLDHAKSLFEFARSRGVNVGEWLSPLEGAWMLKDLFLPNPKQDPMGGPFEGRQIKAWLQMVSELAGSTPKTSLWIARARHPNRIPEGMEEEWGHAVGIIERHFKRHPMLGMEPERVQWALRKIDLNSRMADLVPDMVQIGNRLARRNKYERLLRITDFLPITRQASSYAAQLRVASAFIGVCEDPYQCKRSYREVLASDSILKQVILRTAYDFHGGYPSQAKRLDHTIRYYQAEIKLLELAAVRGFFDAFDLNHDGKIPYRGQVSSELREIMNLAYSFLRFISLRSNGEKESENAPMRPTLAVKPGALAATMGLVGDRWLPDGNADGHISPNELYGIIKIYESIENSTWSRTYDFDKPVFTSLPPDVHRYHLPEYIFFGRFDFVTKLPEWMGSDFSFAKHYLSKLPLETKESLFHALVGVPDEPITVRPINGGDPVTLSMYAQPADVAAPFAIISFLERLMVRCDANEDDRYSWKELGCVSPLVLEAALQTVSSELVDIDAGMHDGAKLLLGFLRQKGLPSLLAKLIFVNGSVRQLNLNPAAVSEVAKSVNPTWEDVARFIGAPASVSIGPWVLEAKRRYGICDMDGDGKLSAREHTCFTDAVISELFTSLETASGVSHEALVRLREDFEASQIVSLGIVLGTQVTNAIDELLEKHPAFHSDNGRMLTILEETIRRGRPLCKLPGC